MPTNGSTPNFALTLPYGGRQSWTDLANGNFRIIDAILATFVSVNNIAGLWTNNTEYTVGQNVIDEDSGVIYTAQVANTSSGAPTTFLEERTDHPTYWLTFATAARQRGAWQTATAYSLNDFVLADGTKYAMCIEAHTSGANFTADLALGRWEVMIDLSAAGSLVLPVLSGAADANKAVMTDSGGNSYVISSMTALAALLNAAGLAALASPAFTGTPTAPTSTAEDNDTSIATTQYADRAVRNLIPRVQTFAASGTYTPNSKMVYAEIRCIGGGGGGGGAATAAANRGWGGQGGAGGYSVKWVARADVVPSQVVTIGAGGTAGTAGANAGGAGGDTSVGALCVGKGGSGGGGTDTAVAPALGGAGGIAGTGDSTFIGNNGASGFLAAAASVVAASTNIGSFLGGAPLGVANQAAGTAAAANTGAGGGGGYTNASGTNQAGGAGGSGYVTVIDYCYG